ncbi:TPA: hypothetical protein N0F65_002733 [Lagenidium giganteum]|uniref:Uncharacterized protein n=1 Tax=Lagenidium giganteum TaxID=4803 RepID=A0AAV2Z490_9STRA|nr:TPA: hypothetical protein N0F65_002733 [Lagenidium giganteum]
MDAAARQPPLKAQGRSASALTLGSTLNPVLRTLGLEEDDPEDVFDIHSKEGAGAFGRVFRATYKKNRAKQAALKVIPVALEAGQRGEDIENVRKEIHFLRECDHPNVVAFYGAYYKDGALWVAMEYCGGGSVGDIARVRRLHGDEIAVIMRGALHGLAYLHARKKIHRDIKGGNILLTTDGQVKIADFGVSAQLRDTMSRRGTFVGTPYWMSPEMIQDSDYDYKSDIWSLGITAIELADQKPPLFDEHPMRVLIQIPRNPSPQLKHPGEWSKEFSQFLQFCLTKNPKERPSALECLQHPFIRRVDHIQRTYATGLTPPSNSSQPSEPVANNRSEAQRPARRSGHREDTFELAKKLASTSDSHESSTDADANTMAAQLRPAVRAAIEEQSRCNDQGSNDSNVEEQIEEEIAEFEELEKELRGHRSNPEQTSIEPGQNNDNVPSTASFISGEELLELSVDESLDLTSEKAHPGRARGDDVPVIQEAPVSSPPKDPVEPSASSDDDEEEDFSLSSSCTLRNRYTGGGASMPLEENQLGSDQPFADLAASIGAWHNPLAGIESSSFSRSFVASSVNSSTGRLLFRSYRGLPIQPGEDNVSNDEEDHHVNRMQQSIHRQSVVDQSSSAVVPTSRSTNHFIGGPFQVSHNVCVKYNSVDAKYEGAPDSEEWSSIHQQFGIPLHQMRCRTNIGDAVPALLHMLRRELLEREGLTCKYIYRVSPDMTEIQHVKAAINRGQFDTATVLDPHVYASLIKHWLRDLPALLLDSLDAKDIENLARLVPPSKSPESTDANLDVRDMPEQERWSVTVEKCLHKLPTLERAVLEWLCDHMLEVIAHSASNKMTAQSICVVMAPNLYRCMSSTPMEASKISNQLANVLRLLLHWRQQCRGTSRIDHGLVTPARKSILSPVASSSSMNSRDFGRQESRRLSDVKGSTDMTKPRSSSTSKTSADNDDQRLDPLDTEALGALLEQRVHDLTRPSADVTPDLRASGGQGSLQRKFLDYQQSVFQLICQHTKRPEERDWAGRVLKKISSNSSMGALAKETTGMPATLAHHRRWVDAATTMEQFLTLVQQEQQTKARLERLSQQPRVDLAALGASTFSITSSTTGSNRSCHLTSTTRCLLDRMIPAALEDDQAPCRVAAGHALVGDPRGISNQEEHNSSSMCGAQVLPRLMSANGNDIKQRDGKADLATQIAALGQREVAVANLLSLLADTYGEAATNNERIAVRARYAHAQQEAVATRVLVSAIRAMVATHTQPQQ